MNTAKTDDSGLIPHARHRRRRPANLRNVGTARADALRGQEADLIEPSRARVLIYGCSVLAGIIQGTDLEGRIESLEAAIKGDDDAST